MVLFDLGLITVNLILDLDHALRAFEVAFLERFAQQANVRLSYRP